MTKNNIKNISKGEIDHLGLENIVEKIESSEILTKEEYESLTQIGKNIYEFSYPWLVEQKSGEFQIAGVSLKYFGKDSVWILSINVSGLSRDVDHNAIGFSRIERTPDDNFQPPTPIFIISHSSTLAPKYFDGEEEEIHFLEKKDQSICTISCYFGSYNDEDYDGRGKIKACFGQPGPVAQLKEKWLLEKIIEPMAATISRVFKSSNISMEQKKQVMDMVHDEIPDLKVIHQKNILEDLLTQTDQTVKKQRM